MKICMIGTGYVGLVTGTCLADLGNDVIFCDTDVNKIALLEKRKMPIYEPGLSEMFVRNLDQARLSFSTDASEAIKACDVVFITVGTPEDESGAADLSYVKSVAAEIGKSLNAYKVVVDKSTVPVGTARLVAKTIKENSNGNSGFDVVSNPEFLREGCAVTDFMNPDRVVIGTDSKRATDIMVELYKPLNAQVFTTNPETAEMIKYASNAFLATKVSFINAIANVCSAAGADVEKVAEGMGFDKRIGKEFLQPGPGYGGSCFPKDCKALVKTADEYGYDFYLLKAVMQVNEDQKRLVGKWAKELLGNPQGQQIGILGLAFKPETDDIRESASLSVIEYLKSQGAKVQAYDPIAMDNARSILGEGIEFAASAYDAVEGCDAVILITHWDEFKKLDYEKVMSLMKQPFFIDSRNCLDPDRMQRLGFVYKGVGK